MGKKKEENKQIQIYDTTLRDGTQGEGISFTLGDKIKVACQLDALGFHYIEGGWPGSNPKDIEFFEHAKDIPWKHAKIAAFGSTCRAHLPAEEDPFLRQLIQSEAPVITIFGKSWIFHVTEVLRTTPEENLRIIRDSVAFLKSYQREVIYDAEHFFDGFKADPEYALATLTAAREGGADLLCLCDTNGGSLPWEVEETVHRVRERLGDIPLGIHTHNDSECGVANSIAAVRAGCVQVQGTFNGWGERIGNANLCSIIPILQLKMGYSCLPPEKLAELTEASLYLYEIANLPPNPRQPFVGKAAFAHKAGMHVDAVLKHPSTFEHIPPEAVGNVRRFLISELSGGSSVVIKAKEFGLDLKKKSPETSLILEELYHKENQGYVFEGAEASFELLVRRLIGQHQPLFDLIDYRVIVEKGDAEEPISEATVKIRVKGQEMHTVAEGDGPVHALDGALRKALLPFYPELEDIRLTDFKVRIVNVKEGTAAKVRVLIETRSHDRSWNTIGVSTNIVEAAWQALVDSIEYGLTYARKNPPEGITPVK